MRRAGPLPPLLLALACLGGAGACGGGEPAAAAPAEQGERGARGPRAPRPPRDERLAPLAEALEAGRAAEVLAALPALAREGLDPLALAELEARARLAGGDGVGALRSVEEARTRLGGGAGAADGFLAALESELYAGMGRANAARDAYRRGLSALGRSPELERARGVLAAVTPGGARSAIEALEEALALDPALPFVDRPLGQAHLLRGRELVGAEPALALEEARAGLARLPGELELVELEAEALEALGAFEEALERLATLAAAGRALGDRPALLHKRAATAALLAGRRPEALEHFRAARALGLDDRGLGFGATALADAAAAEVERGVRLVGAGSLEEAEAALARALELDPASLEARHFLGVARFHRGRYAEAAEAWGELLARARRAGAPLPDPVHLDLARAWRMAGEPERAAAVLREALEREPDGRWVAQTREMLERLER